VFAADLFCATWLVDARDCTPVEKRSNAFSKVLNADEEDEESSEVLIARTAMRRRARDEHEEVSSERNRPLTGMGH
jgi:hypothetical protein